MNHVPLRIQLLLWILVLIDLNREKCHWYMLHWYNNTGHDTWVFKSDLRRRILTMPKGDVFRSKSREKIETCEACAQSSWNASYERAWRHSSETKLAAITRHLDVITPELWNPPLQLSALRTEKTLMLYDLLIGKRDFHEHSQSISSKSRRRTPRRTVLRQSQANWTVTFRLTFLGNTESSMEVIVAAIFAPAKLYQPPVPANTNKLPGLILYPSGNCYQKWRMSEGMNTDHRMSFR